MHRSGDGASISKQLTSTDILSRPRLNSSTRALFQAHRGMTSSCNTSTSPIRILEEFASPHPWWKVKVPFSSGGLGSRVDRGLPFHEFEPGTTKDPPCRVAMQVKSVESSNVLPLVWCVVARRGRASYGVIHVT
ncbi:hypothetical protein TNCV_1169071 [Trichonephila clavipes]|uniref:Uncharacterized protein n=1 Tax=Trichonephila clavipes TaxID=2585209 RepID=A0A8X6T1V9_TRICX|nr:hypothetical protein TNCV_1169071 [Trichonephila clavipes]